MSEITTTSVDAPPVPLVEVRDLSKYFGRRAALRGLGIAFRAGEFVALLGRNGAGKTTLLRILAGLTRPSSGSVAIRGLASPAPAAARGMMGYLAHSTSLYMDLTALENLDFYARLFGLSCREEDLVRRIERVGLAGREREPVRNFSRGMQQRLAIARAFLHDPDIVLLDEPFTGLDQGGIDFLQRYLSQCRVEGKTCLMAIHDLRLGYSLSDRLVVIERGMVALDSRRDSISLEDLESRCRALWEENRHAG